MHSWCNAQHCGGNHITLASPIPQLCTHSSFSRSQMTLANLQRYRLPIWLASPGVRHAFSPCMGKLSSKTRNIHAVTSDVSSLVSFALRQWAENVVIPQFQCPTMYTNRQTPFVQLAHSREGGVDNPRPIVYPVHELTKRKAYPTATAWGSVFVFL